MVLRRRSGKPDQSEFLFDDAKVDVVALSPDGGTAELMIAAHIDWTGSDVQIRSLQEKINTYVGYATDGELAKGFPEVAGMPWRIVVACSIPPDPRTADVLDRGSGPVQGHGGELEVRVSGQGS